MKTRPIDVAALSGFVGSAGIHAYNDHGFFWIGVVFLAVGINLFWLSSAMARKESA